MTSANTKLGKGHNLQFGNAECAPFNKKWSSWSALQSIIIQDRQDLLDFVVCEVSEKLNLDKLSVYLLETYPRSSSSFFHYCRYAGVINDEFMAKRSNSFIAEDGIFNVVMESDQPVIWNMEEVSRWHHPPARLMDCLSQGISTTIGISINDGERKIGGVLFGYKNAEHISQKEIESLRQFCAHIGPSVGTISTIDRSLKKIKDVECLLALTEDLYKVKDRSSLTKIITADLTPYLSFTGLMVILGSSEDCALAPYILNFEQNNFQQNDDRELMPYQFKSDLTLLTDLISSREAKTWAMQDLMRLPVRPDFLTRYRAKNIKSIAGVTLTSDNNNVGALFLFSDRCEHFSTVDLHLINDIAQPIAKAVDYINLLEESAIKNMARDIILSIPNAFEVAGDAHQLQKRLQVAFEKCCLFSEGCVYFLGSSIDTRRPIVLKQTASRLLERSEFLTLEVNEAEDLFLKTIQNIAEPVCIDLNEFFNGKSIPDYVSSWKAHKIRTVTIVPFLINGQVPGVFFLISTESLTFMNRYLSLISGVMAQITASINYALTNELLNKQLKEIDTFKDQLETQNLYVQEEIQSRHNYSEIIGTSRIMRHVFFMVSQVSKTDSSVLILGETGTGKELIARAVHNASLRKEKMMIKVNCGALPPNLIESELFGHERGSFTGATERRIGKFELANNSTLFLDEIGEMPLTLQVKLLRALQEKEIERIGGKSTIKVDVRIIAASNRDLLKEVNKGSFRQDLYFRLNVFPIHLPSLRERKEDISILANHFAEKYSKKLAKNCVYFTSKVMKRLIAYNWPGNVRELEHLVERSILLSKGKAVNEVYLPGIDEDGNELALINKDVKTIDEVEREHIISVLKMANGKISGVGGAAEMLKIPATTLASKIIKLKIEKGVLANGG